MSPMEDEVWLICGGRDFADQGLFDRVMREVVSERGFPDRIVHGKARGADTMAGNWARDRGIEVVEMEAAWDELGKAAGPIQNQAMLDEQKPVICISFPGGVGTADMVFRAIKAKIETVIVSAVAGTMVTIVGG